MILHGRNLIIKKDGWAIAAAKSCSISVTTNMIETGSMSSSKWREFIEGRSEWSIDVSTLVKAQVDGDCKVVGRSGVFTYTRQVNGEANIMGHQYGPGNADKLSIVVLKPNKLYTFIDFDSHSSIYQWFQDNVSLTTDWVFMYTSREYLMDSIMVEDLFDIFNVNANTGKYSWLLVNRPGTTPETTYITGAYEEDVEWKMKGIWNNGILQQANIASPIRNILLQRGSLYTLSVNVIGDGYDDTALTGTAWCKQANISGPVGSLMTGSWKFQGTGPLAAPTST